METAILRDTQLAGAEMNLEQAASNQDSWSSAHSTSPELSNVGLVGLSRGA